ncbi:MULTISPECIES: hypothetical protein [Photobacterium]|uniref:Uncharacterized protein n=1 Tax=Photobacterium carnosum TaxID=2023717 RepID=A0A2N4UW75_9GAMM|nr:MULTISPECIES: hypothetical protein [Photobacterium]MCD9538147.1 hypothetical protein [Photobacterium carnosum]MCD9553166.1 hypothetical protein [Photobacterium carnosum]PLC59266.1 hypothetical protein CIK00_03085 [Photobacterium carnosum]
MKNILIVTIILSVSLTSTTLIASPLTNKHHVVERSNGHTNSSKLTTVIHKKVISPKKKLKPEDLDDLF